MLLNAHIFTNSQRLNDTAWRCSISNFTHINEEIRQVWGKIHLRLETKYDCPSFRETQACLTTFCKELIFLSFMTIQ